MKKRILLPRIVGMLAACAAAAVLLSAPAAPARSGSPTGDGLPIGDLSREGDAACVPKPLIAPPPLPRPPDGNAERASPHTGRLPCPDGFVPQPKERHVARGAVVALSGAPARAAAGAAATAVAADFYYAGGSQNAAGAGATAFFTEHRPLLAQSDYHSLAEMAVKSSDQRQIVEVGWTVDRALNGDDLPRLFVYHWVNGVPACYNGCGWVQFSAALRPGMPVSTDGTARQYMILFWQGDWWIGYEGEWMGYFPGSLWGGLYTASGLIQWFGEIAGLQGATPPLSSMGSGASGSSGSPDAAQVNFAGIFNSDGTTRPAAPALMNFFSYSSRYNAGSPVGQCLNCFRYGGTGGL